MLKPVSISDLWSNEDLFSKRFERAQYAIQQKQSITIWGDRPKISPADKAVDAVRNLFTVVLFGFAFAGSVYFQFSLSLAIVLMGSSFVTFFVLLSVRHVLIKESKRKWVGRRLGRMMDSRHDSSFETMVFDVVAYSLMVSPELVCEDDSEFELRDVHRFAFPPLADEIAYGLMLSFGHQKPYSEIQQAVHAAALRKPVTLKELALFIEVEIEQSTS